MPLRSVIFILISSGASAFAMCLPQHEYRTITLVEGQSVETSLGTFHVTTAGRIGTIDRYGHRRLAPHAQTPYLDELCAEQFGDEFEYSGARSSPPGSEHISEYLMDGVNLISNPLGLDPYAHNGNTRYYSCRKLVDPAPECNRKNFRD